MRFSSLRSPACVLALASLVLAETASDVLKLNAANFEETVSSNPLMLIEFFAPWCGHCKALAPHYEEAATALKEKNIILASVDCVDEADLCQAKEVQGYPTLKVYKNGKPTDYTGARKADGIISYMVKQSLPAVSEVTAENHEEFQKADKLVVVAYLPSSTSEPAPEFSATADKHRDDYLFGLSTDEAVIKAAGVKAPAIVVYRSYDEPRSEYPYPVTSATTKDLEDWLGELAIPVIDEVSGENYAIYAQSPKPLAYLFLDPTSEKKEAQIAAIRPVALKYKSKVNFVWIDAIKFGDHAKALNLQEAKWPAFVVQNLEKQLKFPLDQAKEFTVEAADAWVEQYLGGKIEPSLKSQPIPETQSEAVYTLVGKSFEDVVFDDSKDVFVEFYASWCGHCKRLAPVWETLAEKFADRKDRLVIAKMEAQDNDLPPTVPFRVSGFPTLKFKPAGSRDFIDYEGDRSLESLTAFVEEHAKNSLVVPKVVSDTDAQAPLGNASEPTTERHDEL
ncbi:Protein disulfide-isomerase [Hypsizygus marmoreus]|uniref:Protein disulfide-isomerase n=1 Tax=Hypsizygus marmoreus TaxID=39966 RepID=A0A369JUR4_HYPMA|nr:Protein disulfide-isomerase [Hypsizygus marmoreus]